MRTEESFAPVVEVAALFSNLRCPWFIAGGWAIDLFLREVTRVHDDVDVAILRRDQRTVRTFLGDWTLVEKFVEGRTEPWRDGEWLALPIHEIHARRSAGAPQENELLLNETANDRWVFRRMRESRDRCRRSHCDFVLAFRSWSGDRASLQGEGPENEGCGGFQSRAAATRIRAAPMAP